MCRETRSGFSRWSEAGRSKEEVNTRSTWGNGMFVEHPYNFVSLVLYSFIVSVLSTQCPADLSKDHEQHYAGQLDDPEELGGGAGAAADQGRQQPVHQQALIIDFHLHHGFTASLRYEIKRIRKTKQESHL